MNTAPVTAGPSPGQVACLEKLVQNLPGLQASPAGHPRRRTELAGHRTTDLRRKADAYAPGLWSGMITVSTASPSWVRNLALRNPSAGETTNCSSSSRGRVPTASIKRLGI